MLAASDLHIAPGRVYPVARSLLEAMAAGCVVLASDTEPHREVIRPGETGLLVDVRDADGLARRALAVLDDPAAHRPLGDAAAALVRERFSQDVCLPRLAEQFGSLAAAGEGWSMNVLFIHDAFPAQFGRLGLELTRQHGWKCQIPGPEPLELPDPEPRDARSPSSCTRCP